MLARAEGVSYVGILNDTDFMFTQMDIYTLCLY